MSSSPSSHRVHTAVVLRSHRLGLTSDRGRRGPLGELSDEGRSSTEAARNRRISMKTATHACETAASEDVQPCLLFRDMQLFTSKNSSFHSNILENILVLLQGLKKDVAPCHVRSEIHDTTDVNKVF